MRAQASTPGSPSTSTRRAVTVARRTRSAAARISAPQPHDPARAGKCVVHVTSIKNVGTVGLALPAAVGIAPVLVPLAASGWCSS